MDTLQIRALIAGLSFGIWPLVLNRSGLSGFPSVLAIVAVIFIAAFPFSIGDTLRTEWGRVNVWFVIVAGLISTVGMLSFNSMLAKAKPENVSSYIVVMTLVQIAVPAIYQMLLSKGVSFNQAAGIVLAIISAWLLMRK